MFEYVAIGLAVAVGNVPDSRAQDVRGLDRCTSEVTAVQAKGPQAPGSNRAVSVEIPIGSVCVGPEFVGDEPVYVRRTSAGNGMTVVEVSATPFESVLGSNERPPGIYKLKVRPDQPAGW